MSLFGALSTAVSGLNGQSAAFSNISDNIANSQTVGFKGTNTAFLDYVTNSTATTNDSGSVQAIPLYQNNVQGTISQNDNPLSFAINGAGFFPVSQEASTTSGTTGDTTTFVNQTFYTRAGDFQLNKSGYLVNSAGNYLNGWNVDASGEPDRNAIAPIQVTQTTDRPVATSKINLSANLPTYDSLASAPGSQSSNVNVYDAQGASHILHLNFSPGANTDEWTLGVIDAGGTTIGTADVVFGADGTVASMTPAGGNAVNTPGASADLPLLTTFPTVPAGTFQTINLNLGSIGGTSGLTEYAATSYTLTGITQDGVPPGSFSSLSNKANGDILANFDNGQSRVVARVPVITFPAPDSLQRQNGSAYSATVAAGTALAHDADSNGAGALEASSSEASNVDIGTEFTKLIVAQRAYSANAKLVTTADDMLQQTIDMKRQSKIAWIWVFAMSLNSILSTAATGIEASSNALAVISHNVANARTPGYVREVANQSAVDGTRGARIDPTTRDLDAHLQAAALAQDAVTTSLTTRQQALSQIDAVQGATASGDDLSSLLANLQSSFTALATDPSNQTQQAAVVASAGTLAAQIARLAGAVATVRQSAQDDAVAAVADLNGALSRIGALSDKIISTQAMGASTADLETQRDAAVAQVNAILPVRAVPQASGDVTIIGQNGLALQTRGASQLALQQATLGTGGVAAAAPPPLTLGGVSVTAAVTGGRLGADLALRDTTLPQYQAGLDEFAHTLADRFDQQGLTLFSNAAGVVPQGGGTPVQAGYLGFSSVIQVNPAALANPSVVRDGLQGQVGTPPSGRSGDTTLITKILDYSFGADQSAGVSQPAPSTNGLGGAGTVALPYAPPQTLVDFSTSLVSAMSGDASDAQDRLDSARSLQTALQAQAANTSGVSIDQEMANMVQVQNAYSANGKVMAAVQAMWASLLGMVN